MASSPNWGFCNTSVFRWLETRRTKTHSQDAGTRLSIAGLVILGAVLQKNLSSGVRSFSSAQAKNDGGYVASIEAGYAYTKVDGKDQTFPLDGELNGLDIDVEIRSFENVVLEFGYRRDEGEFTRTDGLKTDYKRDIFNIDAGYNFAPKEATNEIIPFIGLTLIDAKNRVTVGGVNILSTQNAQKGHLGLRVGKRWEKAYASISGGWELTIDEDQEVPTTGISQKGEVENSFFLKAKMSYQLTDMLSIGIKPEFRYDDFDQKNGARNVTQEEYSVTVFTGLNF